MAQDYFISSVPDKGVGLYYTPFPKPTPCIASSCVAQPPQNSDFDGPVAKVRLVLWVISSVTYFTPPLPLVAEAVC